MKKKILLSTFFAVITFVAGITVSCNKEDLQLQTQKEYLSITQAKTAFENELLNYGIDENSDLLAATASIADNASERYLATFELSPGEYTPQWDESIICRNSNFEAVNTPLTVQYIFAAVRTYSDQQPFRQTGVWVTQKLISIRRYHHPNTIENYILSIIPTEKYAKQYNCTKDIAKIFQYGNDLHEFSGIALFHSLDGELKQAELYKTGQIIVSLDNSVPTSYTQFTDRLNSITGDLGFAKYLANDKPYTKLFSPDLEPQPGTGITLSVAQVRGIVNLGATGNRNGNGYVNIRSAFSPSRGGGYLRSYVPVSDNDGREIIINQMSIGYNASNPSLNYDFRNYGTDVSTVKEYGTGNFVKATTYIYHNDTKQETSDLRVTVTNSQKDAYETMMGH